MPAATSITEPNHSRVLFDEHWQRTPQVDAGDQRRVRTIAELCPQVDTLLEVGCGNGEVLRALAPRARLRWGCDSSAVGLQAALAADPRRDSLRVLQSTSDRLPFRDRAFELVACCDVLEHLREPAALGTVLELMRVSARYVLVNLPLDEDLAWSRIRCDACGHVYHRDHHQRSYRRRQVEELLPAVDFVLEQAQETGWTVRHPLQLPEPLGLFLGLGHDPTARCERCGERPAPLPSWKRRLREGFWLAYGALTRPLHRACSRDTEIVALFRRR